jgi:hypothetical protein
VKPLYWIAVGLVFVLLEGRTESGWDIYPNPLGWLLVLVGLRRLDRAVPGLPLRLALWYLGALALVVSAALVAPDAQAWLSDADPAVIWASDLPALGFQAALCHVLAQQAGAARARGGAWWRVAEVGLLVGIVAPVLYFGADWTWLQGVGNIGYAAALLVVLLCLVFGARPWAGAPEVAVSR